MSADPRRAAVMAAAAELTGDLRAWVEWVAETGAVELPAERLGPTPALTPSAPAPAAPAARDVAAAPAPPRSARVTPGASRAPESGQPRTAAPRPAARPGLGGLEVIASEIKGCQRCGLASGRRNLVFGVGSPSASLVLVGEAPGYHEDLTGEPFVGRSGQLLTRMLAAIGLERGGVYICNVIKCRPPNNRDPVADEIATCSPFLHRQIEAIGPRVIMTLGRFAACNIIGVESSLGALRRRGGVYHQIPVVPTYHPAYLLRNPAAKRAAWEDLLKVRALLGGAIGEPRRAP